MIISDTTKIKKANSGYQPRAASDRSDGFATPFNLPLIPEAEWASRIDYQQQTQSSLHHVWQRSPVGVLNQNPLLYCHAFSPAVAMMILRAAQGLPYVELSASSIGGPATGYRNRGAWIGQDLKVITERGACTTEFVPMRQVSRSGWKPGADENAKLHKATEWFELRRRNFNQVATCLLNNIPVCVGLNWWRHAVTYLALLWRNNKPAVLFINSWGANWGDGGLGILEGSRMVPDEAYALTQITSSIG